MVGISPYSWRIPIIYAGINEYCRKTGRENVIRSGLKNLIAKAFEKE
jgi:hypothetical protein